jgi:hypothetical protein
MGKVVESIKPISGGLSRISDYLLKIERDTQNGWYFIEVGIPSDWIFESNDIIECKIIQEGGGGKLVKISPKNENIYVDDLVTFVEVINATNKQISEKEILFKDKMKQMKDTLQQEALKFYEELDEMKKHSFETISSKLGSDTTVTEPTTEPTEKSSDETTDEQDAPANKQAIDKQAIDKQAEE